ncbi:hypothetical protein CA12_36580 [Alienimonas californiensis]|uniref:Uncharacterized protein n=1 Tax=Alienimonas californiensis TaxID=2527989 RepID=A0A517PDW4_9PLAN|nr:hypothetical protein CA12_36580 [Alienimonas californiensis]
MTVLGWIIMGTSITTVLVVLAYCLVKVLTLPPVEDELP